MMFNRFWTFDPTIQSNIYKREPAFAETVVRSLMVVFSLSMLYDCTGNGKSNSSSPLRIVFSFHLTHLFEIVHVNECLILGGVFFHVCDKSELPTRTNYHMYHCTQFAGARYMCKID